jgi:hypothetical protein
MRKVLVSFGLLIAAILFFVKATGAYLSDRQASLDNSFQAGSIDLTVNGKNLDVQSFALADAAPGSSGSTTLELSNTGSLRGYLSIEEIRKENYENNCNDPETRSGDVTCGVVGLGEGELPDILELSMYLDTNRSGVLDIGEPKLYQGSLAQLPKVLRTNASLATQEIQPLVISYRVAPEVGNTIQTDSVTWDFFIGLHQLPQ